MVMVTDKWFSSDSRLTFGGNVSRQQVFIVLGFITLISLALRILALQSTYGVESDTNAFLELVAMMHGSLPAGVLVPFRIENPLYSILIFFTEPFTADWLVAAKLMALLPGSLVPPLLCLIAWSLDQRLLTGFFAGLLGAFSLPLVSISATPLSDSLFIFFSALSVLAGLAFLRKPTYLRAFFAGISTGLAWATRGPGLFYFIAIIIPVSAALWWHLREYSTQKGHSKLLLNRLGQILIFSIAFFLCGRGPTYALQPFTEGLKPPISYLKIAFVDGGLYAQGGEERDKQVYSLNKENTGFSFSDEMYRLSWREILQKYGKQQLKAFLKNIVINVTTVLPSSLQPFFLIFLPFAIGLIFLWIERPLTESLSLILFAFPYLVIIPAIQLHDRYIYPITVIGLPLTAWGLIRQMDCTGAKSMIKIRFSQALAVVIVASYCLYGAHQYIPPESSPPYDWSLPYQEASQWIKQHYGNNFNFQVMSRYHGVDAYLGRNKVSLPVDSLDRVAQYCQHTNTRYILLGPEEIKHNPHLAILVDKNTIEIGDVVFETVSVFGQEPYAVRLIEVKPQTSSS